MVIVGGIVVDKEGWMSVWMNECMDVWMNEPMNESISYRVLVLLHLNLSQLCPLGQLWKRKGFSLVASVGGVPNISQPCTNALCASLYRFPHNVVWERVEDLSHWKSEICVHLRPAWQPPTPCTCHPVALPQLPSWCFPLLDELVLWKRSAKFIHYGNECPMETFSVGSPKCIYTVIKDTALSLRSDSRLHSITDPRACGRYTGIEGQGDWGPSQDSWKSNTSSTHFGDWHCGSDTVTACPP